MYWRTRKKRRALGVLAARLCDVKTLFDSKPLLRQLPDQPSKEAAVLGRRPKMNLLHDLGGLKLKR